MDLDRRHFLTVTVAASAVTVVFSGAVRPGAQAGPAQHIVEIHKFKFSPDTLIVKPGDTITWVNKDIVPHTATATDKSWDTGKIKKGERARIVVGEAFQESYFCRYHTTMKATVSVEN